MTMPGIPPRQEVTETLAAIIHACDFAVDYELLRQPTPVSSIRGPGGLPQPETGAERSHRTVETAIMYAIENGLLVVPEDVAERFEGYLPVQRAPAGGSRP